MPEYDVSVIVPAYDRPRELRRTLVSLAGQTLSQDRFEVIVVDDASPQDVLARSYEVLDRMKHTTVLRNETNKGASGTRNAGARIAQAPLLVFLDIDGLAHPGLLEAHIAAQAARPIAACGYTHGRELTPSSWSLLLGPEWDLEQVEQSFDRAAAIPLLHDPLTELLAEPAETDWAFFWTLNVSVPRSAFEQVGGFSEDFTAKGVEDIELGLRLHQAGVPTVFIPEAKALHQPHPRDRHRELLRDRRHDLRLLTLHPRPEVEAVCSFDIVNARGIQPTLTAFAERLPPAAVDCAGLKALPEVADAVRAADRVLLLGSLQGWPDELPRPEVSVCPTSAAADDETTRHLRLLGTRLPFVEQTFDLALITDFWRTLPERTLCRVLEEALRCSRTLVVLADVSTMPPPGPDQVLGDGLEAHDRPFWEASVAIARELHQFRFSEFGHSVGGPRALRVEQVEFPLTRLSEIASTA